MSKKSFLSFLFFFLTLTFSTFSFSQDQEDEDYDDATYSRIKPKHSFTMELGMPVGFNNKGFKGFLQGMVNFSPYYHYNFKNNVSVGLGANYNFFWINHVLSPDKDNVGAIHSIGGFLELGHEKFYTDRVGTDFSIKAGYSQLNYYSTNNRALGLGTPKQNVAFIEPTFSLIVTADEFTSYRWIVGYVFQNYKFDPTKLGFADSKEYHTDDYSKLTQFLSFGFGFTYYFKQH
jgi:hypothetical protein